MCNSTKGRLIILPDGTVVVQQENGQPFSNAQCFTSLDGASFALINTGFKPLALVNGWSNAPFGTSNVAARRVSGAVTFQGAVAGGSGAGLFVLPLTMLPKKGGKTRPDVYVNIDLCDAHKGRLVISGMTGAVSVQPQSGDPFSNAQCFTSLEGVSFVP
jgi:hypothetical protein